jgi:hypothetical protein
MLGIVDQSPIVEIDPPVHLFERHLAKQHLPVRRQRQDFLVAVAPLHCEPAAARNYRYY